MAAMREFIYPAKPQTGERVAILSPSSGLPGLFPHVFELGLRRLEDQFHLTPVEYSTTRQMGSSLAARVVDIHSAFADPDIRAVICSIGGEDQIKLLKLLDPELLKAHPKPFFGYSDNTNLHLFLWNLGIVSYYGGAIMTSFARAGAMSAYSLASLQQALFGRGEFEITPAGSYTDEDVDWDDTDAHTHEPPLFPGGDWTWQHPDEAMRRNGNIITGPGWGGDLTILRWQLEVGRYLPPDEAFNGAILFIETDEELPPAIEVYRTLMLMGERGLLQRFSAILIARPKAWALDHRHSAAEKAAYVEQQAAAIGKALDEYCTDTLAVFNLDFGHTDPQVILPSGGLIRIDLAQRRIFATY